MMPESAVTSIVDARGYDDIDPEHCWEQWVQVREQFSENNNASEE